MLYGEGRMIGVRQPVARQLEGGGHAAEYAPVAVARAQRQGSRLGKQGVDERDGGLPGRGRMEDPGGVSEPGAHR